MNVRLALPVRSLFGAAGLAAALSVQAGPPAAAEAAAQPPGLDAERPARCAVPAEFDADAEPLPELARALKSPAAPITVVVLGPQAGGGARELRTGSIAYPPRLQALLSNELAPELAGRKLVVEAVTRPRGSTHDLAALIPSRVLPLKPALVVWQVGRADARRGNPPYRFSQAIGQGVDLLQRNKIDTILMDIQYHPQFEALYRTDDYRQHLRWFAGNRNLPLLRRYQMIEYWITEGRIDLDSGQEDVQRRASDFIQDCVAHQAARMIDAGLALARRR